MTEKYFLSWKEQEKLTERLAKKINSQEINLIVGVSRGGLILGAMLSDQLSLPLAIISANSYNFGELSKAKRKIKISEIATTSPLEGSLLLVDDLVDSGETLYEIESYLRTRENITRIQTATFYKKPHSKFTPTYFVEETTKFIVFPAMKNEFKYG